MKQLFENKKLMIGIAIGLVIIIGTVLFFVFRKSGATSGTATANNSVASNASNTTVAKQVADTTGGTVSASDAITKGTLFV